MKLLKSVQIITGILALVNLICTLGILFTQPSLQASQNDKMFVLGFGVSMFWVVAFLVVSRNIDKTANRAKQY